MQKVIIPLFISLLLLSCNKDENIIEYVYQKPTVELDSETGIYTTKIGKQITITPTVKNADNAVFVWYEGEHIVGREEAITRQWDEAGEYYLTFCVLTTTDRVEEEIKVEVQELTPPLISILLPSNGLKVLQSTDYVLTPDIQHSDMDDFKIQWLLNDKVVCEDISYTFHEEELGIYKITIIASNIDGVTTKDFNVEVVDALPYEAYFPSQSYFQSSTTRYTLPGRPVYLTPITSYFDSPQYNWSVDDEHVDIQSETFRFTPSIAGEYAIRVEVSETPSEITKNLTRNITRGNTSITAEILVVCLPNSEESLLREKTHSSSAFQNKVYEFVPAPGQFINETHLGGYTGKETTHNIACEWAEERLREHNYVSLGTFGGYIIVGFDHSILSTSEKYDFAIEGNAFNSINGGSNEPGVIWVMQDTNGNGLPDDEWYELRGSETGVEGTIQDYAVTYYKPTGPGQNINWIDSNGTNGYVDYLMAYHRQDSYYPLWIKAESYTLRGTCLSAKSKLDPATGYWSNEAYGWGYADNMGHDCLGGNDIDGSGQRNGFKISNAMYTDGTSINLKFIDFIKVQQGVLAKAGALGENSCEVFSFQDYSMMVK